MIKMARPRMRYTLGVTVVGAMTGLIWLFGSDYLTEPVRQPMAAVTAPDPVNTSVPAGSPSDRNSPPKAAQAFSRPSLTDLGLHVDQLPPLGISQLGSVISVSPICKDLFDFILDQYPDQSDDIIWALLKGQLTESGARQAYQLWQRYLGFRDQVKLENSHQSVEASFVELLRDRVALRTDWFDDELGEALLASDQAQDQAMIDKLEIIGDGQMTQDQKQKALETWQQDLPEQMGSSRTQWQQASSFRQQESGLSDTDPWQQRASQFGVEAADRLQRLDQSRELWQQAIVKAIERLSSDQAPDSGGGFDERLTRVVQDLFPIREQRHAQIILKQKMASYLNKSAE